MSLVLWYNFISPDSDNFHLSTISLFFPKLILLNISIYTNSYQLVSVKYSRVSGKCCSLSFIFFGCSKWSIDLKLHLVTRAIIVLFVREGLTTAQTFHLTNLCLQTARHSELDGTCLLPKVVKVYINKSICFVPWSHPGTTVSVLSYAAYMLIRWWRASYYTETSHLLCYEGWQGRNTTL